MFLVVFRSIFFFYVLFYSIRNDLRQVKTNELPYGDYKHFNYECFEKDLRYALSTFEKLNYQDFYKTFFEILNKYVPMKK